MNKYDKILNLFYDPGHFKEAFRSPNLVDGLVYSTDGTMMAIVLAEHTDVEYKCHPKAPNFKGVIPMATMRKAFSVKALKSALNKFEKVAVHEECEQCSGGGEILCTHCGSVNECKACNGDGFTGKQIGETFDFSSVIDFGVGATLGANCVQAMVDAAELEGSKSIALLHGGNKQAHLFEIGSVQILVMPREVSNAKQPSEKLEAQ